MNRFWLTFLLVALATQSVAQDVIGRANVEGREILILENGKWRYLEEIETGCRSIVGGVQFCGESVGWVPMPLPNEDVNAQHRIDHRHYGQIIVEDLGLNDGITVKYMRSAVLENAAFTTNQTVDDINVLTHFDTTIDEFVARTIVYQFKIDGLDVVFANGIVTSPNRTMQVMTFATDEEFTDRHKELHDEYLSHYKLSL